MRLPLSIDYNRTGRHHSAKGEGENVGPSSVLNSVLSFFDDHGQGLAAAAAIVGIPVLIIQITLAGRQERRRIEAKRLAALSTLPITLDAIIAWSADTATSLRRIYPRVKGSSKAIVPYNPPRPPTELIGTIEKMIEAAPKHRVAVTLAAIVSEIQILSARMKDIDVSTLHRARQEMLSIDDNLVRAASIYAHAQSLYGDARKLSEDAPLDYARIDAALSILSIGEEDHEKTHALVARGAERQRLRIQNAKLSTWLKKGWNDGFWPVSIAALRARRR